MKASLRVMQAARENRWEKEKATKTPRHREETVGAPLAVPLSKRCGVVILLAVIVSLPAPAQTEGLKVPEGCRPAEGAKAALEGYADRIIHGKSGIEMILISPGRCKIGRSRPVRSVTIRSAFYIGKTEITNGQFRKFLKESAYDGKGDADESYDLYLRHFRGKSTMSADDEYPVVWVSWKNAKAFCDWAGFALPSEVQWEYACRAGTATPYYFGADEKEFDKYGWALALISKEYHTQPVAKKLPNPWGLYDMLGNVWEWVEDDFFEDQTGGPADETARLAGRMTKVIKGGCWGSGVKPYAAGCGARYSNALINASAEIGFRVILPVPELSLPAGVAEDPGLVAWYRFEEASGDVVLDSSGWGNHGKNFGAKYMDLGEGKGFALALKSPGAWVDCGDDPSLDLGGAVTIELWVHPQTKMEKGQVGLAGKHYESYLVTYTNACWFYISQGRIHCRALGPFEGWNHIAATYDGKTLKLYHDGALEDTREYGHRIQQGKNFYLGSPPETPYPGHAQPAQPPLEFMLDDVRVYDRALSEDEIVAHYREGAKEKGR